jgi:hypothetical protein
VKEEKEGRKEVRWKEGCEVEGMKEGSEGRKEVKEGCEVEGRKEGRKGGRKEGR